MAVDDYCYLTTTGRRTGRPHRIEIWYARAGDGEGDTLYLLAGGGRSSDWVRNLEADPAATVELDGTIHNATARVLDDGSEEEAEARRLVFDKYQPRSGDELTDWRRRALPVVLRLTDLLEV